MNLSKLALILLSLTAAVAFGGQDQESQCLPTARAVCDGIGNGVRSLSDSTWTTKLSFKEKTDSERVYDCVATNSMQESLPYTIRLSNEGFLRCLPLGSELNMK